MRGSRPCRAEPPAESPSTMKTSHSAGLVDWQSDSLPGRPPPPSRPLRRAGQVAGLAGGDPGRGRGLGLADDVLALGGVLLQPGAELVVDDPLHEALGLGVAELGLGLALELRLAELDRDDRGEALADVVAGDPVLALLDQAPLLAPVVDQGGERRAEALLVGAALVGVDGVGEGVHRLGVAGVPLHRDLEAQSGVVARAGLGLEVDDARVGRVLAPVEVLDVVDEAAVVTGRSARARRSRPRLMASEPSLVDLGVDGGVLDGVGDLVGRRPLVADHDLEALVEEGHLADPGGDRLEGVVGGLEDPPRTGRR